MFRETSHKNATAASNQDGFASLVISLVLIMVMALMTIGFAQLARHEQRQALNHQLAAQAFYAAESGINDVVQAIQTKAITSATPNVNTNRCVSMPNSAIGGTGYTCVLISLDTPDISFNSVGSGEARTILTSTTPAQISQLVFSWDSADNHTAVRPLIGQFTALSAWNNAPAVIQLSITPINGNDFKRTDLLNNTYTVMLYPNNSNVDGTYAPASNGAGQGNVISGHCNNANPYECRAVINMAGAPAGPYLIHFLNLYDESSVQITAAAGATSVTFNGGQAKIDVTGKSKNVLKRLQVRVPLDTPAYDYSLQAQTICKRQTTRPNNTDFWNPDNTAAGNGDQCSAY